MMATKIDFLSAIRAGCAPKGGAIAPGAAMFNSEVLAEAPNSLPLRTMNRNTSAQSCVAMEG